MKLLLDTHAWLWLLTEPERLGSTIDFLEDEANDLYLSAASTWEIAIKYALGRLPLPEAPGVFLPSHLQSTGATPIPISTEDTYGVAALPHHHRDPFDRLLIAQARNRDLTIVSLDSQFAQYDVALLPHPASP